MTGAKAVPVFTVALSIAGHQRAEEQAAVLSSLPQLFVLTAAPDADIILVDGSPGWPGAVAAAAARSPRAIVVHEPSAAADSTVQDVRERTTLQGTPVIVLRRHTADPTWAAAAEEARANASSALSISMLTTIRSDPADTSANTALLTATLLSQIAVLRQFLSEPVLTRGRGRGRHYVATGPGGVTLSAIVTGAGSPGLELQIASSTTRWEARFDDSAIATPTVITRHDATGRTSSPGRWESGYRAGWRALHQSLRAGGVAGDDLWILEDDTRIAASVLRDLESSPTSLLGTRDL